MRHGRTGRTIVLGGALWLAAIEARSAPAGETALDRYVARPDPSYSWKLADAIERDGAKQFVIALTSQSWRSPQEVDRTLWEHWLVVVVPPRVEARTAFLLIGGGRNRPEPPRGADELALRMALETGSVAAELRMVPNQPLVFNGDGKARSEDDLIAYTWDRYLKTGDETWPARLPMVKSAVRAMDCVQEFLRSERGGGHPIEAFTLAGGSKRGWTTWCTAAVDRRVKAIVPIVIDVLNVAESMRHHVAVYGFYSAAVGDYHRQGLMRKEAGDPRLRALYEIEDPYSYRARLTMPKYVVNASGDEFFCPDSSRFYWEGLPGEKTLRYVPNAPHSLRETDAAQGIIAFHHMVLSAKPRPAYAWTFEKDGAIRVTAREKPREVRLWHATNTEARDFRFYKIGRAYASRPLAAEADGSFIGRVEPPARGWTAFFVELDFESGCRHPLKASTAVRVLPERLPHPEVDPLQAPLEEIPGRG
jgi:PhoPQ-activated pathogenicity-related protein